MPKPIHKVAYKMNPEVWLDQEKDIFLIKGKSFPEDSILYYKDVMEWFDEYFKNPNPKTIVKIELEYYNSSSARSIASILKLLEEQYQEGKDVEVHWYYNPNDETMKENGEDFSILFSLPVKIISKQ